MVARDSDEPESAKDLTQANPISVASNIALRQLSMSPKTRFQLEQKLAQKGTSPEVIATVITRMTELGYIDDLAYALMYIRSKSATKFLSRRSLSYELNKRGIDKEIIEQALAGISDEDDYQSARALVEKKVRAMSSLDHETKMTRLMGALARKGYSSAVASRVIREILSEMAV